MAHRRSRVHDLIYLEGGDGLSPASTPRRRSTSRDRRGSVSSVGSAASPGTPRGRRLSSGRRGSVTGGRPRSISPAARRRGSLSPASSRPRRSSLSGRDARSPSRARVPSPLAVAGMRSSKGLSGTARSPGTGRSAAGSGGQKKYLSHLDLEPRGRESRRSSMVPVDQLWFEGIVRAQDEKPKDAAPERPRYEKKSFMPKPRARSASPSKRSVSWTENLSMGDYDEVTDQDRARRSKLGRRQVDLSFTGSDPGAASPAPARPASVASFASPNQSKGSPKRPASAGAKRGSPSKTNISHASGSLYQPKVVWHPLEQFMHYSYRYIPPLREVKEYPPTELIKIQRQLKSTMGLTQMQLLLDLYRSFAAKDGNELWVPEVEAAVKRMCSLDCAESDLALRIMQASAQRFRRKWEALRPRMDFFTFVAFIDLYLYGGDYDKAQFITVALSSNADRLNEELIDRVFAAFYFKSWPDLSSSAQRARKAAVEAMTNAQRTARVRRLFWQGAKAGKQQALRESAMMAMGVTTTSTPVPKLAQSLPFRL